MEQTPSAEREHWDAKAGNPRHLPFEMWAEPGADWGSRTQACLDAILPALMPALVSTPNPRVVDLGCGIARLTLPVARRHADWQLVGVDIAPQILDEAERRRHHDHLANVTFVRGDGRRLPPVGPTHAAWSMLMFQHIPAEAVAGYIAQVADALVQGGRFRFQVVEGDEADAGWMSHPAAESDVLDWCADADLIVKDVDHGRLMPEWLWVTAVKR